MYTSYVFAPPARVSAAVRDSDDRFSVRRIYCVGRNYTDHVREMGGDPQRDPPVFFAKPGDALTASGVDVPYPPATSDLHHEVELVVAIGRGGRALDAEHALQHVFGYAVGNDLTRRDIQNVARASGLPWDMSKGFDASAQLGVLSPAERFGHPAGEAQIWLAVNGTERQRSRLDAMIWSVPEIIAALSRLVTLEPGDLIFTGTPHGVGALQPGDQVSAGIDGLDGLEFRVTAAS